MGGFTKGGDFSKVPVEMEGGGVRSFSSGIVGVYYPLSLYLTLMSRATRQEKEAIIERTIRMVKEKKSDREIIKALVIDYGYAMNTARNRLAEAKLWVGK